MDIKKAKTYLEKINLLYQGIQDDGQISPIEKKLMLDYISNLYDCFWYNEAPAVVEKPAKKSKKDKVKATTKKINKPVPAPKPVAPPAPVVEKPEPVVEKKEAAPPPPPQAQEVKEEKPKPRKYDFELPKARNTSAAPAANKAYNELFEQEATKDLSQKISQRPLSNLKRAWGVADKFLVINELFGKDVSSFDEAIDTLNNMSSMEEARAYIEGNLIDKHQWMDDAKLEQAKRFIKTVRRRYL